MLTSPGLLLLAVSMVTVVAHVFGIVLFVGVGTPVYLSPLSLGRLCHEVQIVLHTFAGLLSTLTHFRQLPVLS